MRWRNEKEHHQRYSIAYRVVVLRSLNENDIVDRIAWEKREEETTTNSLEFIGDSIQALIKLLIYTQETEQMRTASGGK